MRQISIASIRAHMTNSQWQAVCAAAKSEGKSIAQFVKDAALNRVLDNVYGADIEIESLEQLYRKGDPTGGAA